MRCIFCGQDHGCDCKQQQAHRPLPDTRKWVILPSDPQVSVFFYSDPQLSTPRAGTSTPCVSVPWEEGRERVREGGREGGREGASEGASEEGRVREKERESESE